MIHFQRIEDTAMPTPALSGREIIAQKERQKAAIVSARIAMRAGRPEEWHDRFMAALHAAGFDVTPFAVVERSIHESSSDLGHG